MKSVSNIIGILLSVVLLSGASSCKDEGPVADGGLFFRIDCPYYLSVKVLDKNGRDLVSGLESKYVLKPELVGIDSDSLRQVSPEEISITEKLEADRTYTKNNLPYLVENSQGQEMLAFYHVEDIRSSYSKKYTITITCPHIFGDSKVHEIESFWKMDDWGNNICQKVTFDNKKCSLEILQIEPYKSYKDFFTYFYEMTIIIDTKK